jgi:hypothetical protein
MHRPGADPENMGPDDFLCDFCGRGWAEDRPMVEGHRGSLICGRCLTVAYTEAVTHGLRSATSGAACTLCLEPRDGPAWASPGRPEAVACLRCIKQSAGVLTKDPEANWRRPEG